MKASRVLFLSIVVPLLASADAGDFFQQQVDAYFASHGMVLPPAGSGTVVSNWVPPATFSISNEICRTVVHFETGAGTNGIPSSIGILNSDDDSLGNASISVFVSQRDAWSSLGNEIVWSSLYGIGQTDKYACTNCSSDCAVFFPLTRHNDEVVGTDTGSATILVCNLRIDVSSESSLAREIALPLAESVMTSISEGNM